MPRSESCECGVSSHTTKSHFQILEDTLLGRWLPAYRKGSKRRVIPGPKFYFVDVHRPLVPTEN